MLRAIRHYTGQTGPDTYETRYQTKDFECEELERFMQGEGIPKNVEPFWGFTGIEIVGGEQRCPKN